jgi:exodeoxyribonuclease VII large subunit
MTSVVAAASAVLTVNEALAMGERALGAISAGEVWVFGEISGLHTSPSGKVYCTLLSEGARLRVCIPPREARRISDRLHAVGVKLADGQAVRVRGRLGCVAAAGAVELRVSGVDPTVTVGATEIARRQLRQKLIAAELIGIQRAFVLPPFPQRVLLIGPEGAMAEEFLSGLNGSPWKWAVTFTPTRGEGLETPAALADAIRTPPEPPQVIVLARRASANPAAYDSEVLARAVCTAAAPVISVGGQGRQGGQGGQHAMVDECAWSAVAAPAAAAELLNRHMTDTSDRVCAKRHSIMQSAQQWTDRNQADVDARMAAIRLAAGDALAGYRVAEAETAVRRAHIQLAVVLAALTAVLIAFVAMGLLK